MSNTYFIVVGQSGFLSLPILSKLRSNAVEYLSLSLRSFDEATVSRHFSEVNSDAKIKVFFASWPTSLPYDDSGHLSYYEHTFCKFFEFLLSRYTNLSVVNLGTCLEYGLLEGPLSESTLPSPSTALGSAKLLCYNFLKSRLPSGKLIHLRIFYPFSFDLPRHGSITWHVKNAIEQGASSFRMSHGEQQRDFISLQSITTLLYQITTFNNPYPVDLLNVGTTKPTKVIDLVESCFKYHKASLPLERGFYQVPSYEPNCFYASHTSSAKRFLKCLA